MQDLQHLARQPHLWVLAGIAGYFVLLFLVSWLERRWVFPYIPVRDHTPDDRIELVLDENGAHQVASPLDYADQTPDPTVLPHYVLVMSDDAYGAGFTFEGLIAHAKPACKITATLWFSVERDVLLLTGAGTVFKMPSFQTWLYSPLKDGRVLITTDNNDEGDRSGMYVTRRVIRQRLDKLVKAHRASIDRFGGQVARFEERSALDAVHGILSRRVQSMVDRGVARYRDPEKLFWSYSAWGSVRGCLGFFTQLARTLPQFYRVNQPAIATHEPVTLGGSAYRRYERRALAVPP